MMKEDGAVPLSHALLGWFTAGLLLVGLLVAGYSVDANASQTNVQLPLEVRYHNDIRAVLPQGWSFFTRNPESDTYVLLRTTNGYASAATLPGSAPSEFSGIVRTARLVEVEAEALKSNVPASDWRQCTDSDTVSTCVTGTATGHEQVYPKGPTSVCGSLILGHFTPTPWAFYKIIRRASRLDAIARLDVECK